MLHSGEGWKGVGGENGEKIIHKVGSMVGGRRREGEGADLELNLIRLSLKGGPWINHHIKLHCHVGAAKVFLHDSSPQTFTFGHFATSCITYKSMQT